jgi:preprotein translocase subunit YajC
MTKLERQLVKALTMVFYGLAIFILVGLIMWFYPRQVVKSSSIMTTEKTSYQHGEEVVVSGETWSNVDSPTDFEVRLICGGVKYPYHTIKGLNVTRQASPVKYLYPYPEIPRYTPKGTCRIETTARYTVEVLPLLDRTYYHTFNSNEFEVK